MKEYLLFDLDGTLTDPKVGITTCVQYALKEFGIEEPDLDKLEPFIGPPLKDSFIKYYNFSGFTSSTNDGYVCIKQFFYQLPEPLPNGFCQPEPEPALLVHHRSSLIH